MTVNQLLRSAVECERESPRFAFIAPYLKQAKDIAWDYVHKFAGEIPGASFNESELRVDLPGDRRLRLYGADNPDSIQGIYLDGVVMDEYQLTHPRLFTQIVRPMLADRQGWAIFCGKPLGHNHFYALYQAMLEDPRRLARLYRASDTGILAEEELHDMRVGPPAMSEDEYSQELECSWEAAITGAYYARQLEQTRASGRIRPITFEPTVPVDTWWDLGYEDSTAIIFGQRVGREIHLIDFLESRGRDLTYYAAEVQRRPYLYGSHTLPHDAGSHQLGAAGRTIAEQLAALGLKGCQILGANDPLDGINQARLVFPRVWFDVKTCGPLIEALANYREQWDDKRRASTGKPLHDWSSHAADAFRYMAISLRDFRAPHGPQSPRKSSKTDFDVFTWNRPKGKSKTEFRV